MLDAEALWTGWSWQTRFSGLPGSRRYSVLKFNRDRDISGTTFRFGNICFEGDIAIDNRGLCR